MSDAVARRLFVAAGRYPVTVGVVSLSALLLVTLPMPVAVLLCAGLVWGAMKASPWQRERAQRRRYDESWQASAANFGLVNRQGSVPTVESIERTLHGRRIFYKLPQGLGPTDLERHAVELAYAHGALRAKVSSPGPGRAAVTYFHVDPLGAGPGPWPGLNAFHVPITTPVPLGIDEDAGQVDISLWQSSVLIGGSPGSGKSAAMQTLIAGAALDAHVDLRIVDAKRGAELGVWRDRTSAFAENETLAVEMLNVTLAEIERRYDAMQALGIRKARYDDASMRPIVLVVDELAEVTGTGTKDAKAAGETLRRIVALGRAASVTVIAATQKPDSTVVPTGLRDLFRYRIGLRCGARGQAETIAAEVAAELCAIPADQPGTAYVGSSELTGA